MRKKNYVSPEIEILKAEVQGSLLATSMHGGHTPPGPREIEGGHESAGDNPDFDF